VAWVALALFVLPAAVEDSGAFEDVVVVLGFAVAGCPCPGPPPEAWRALAADTRRQTLSSALATLNLVFKIFSSAWTVNVNPRPVNIAAAQ